MVTLDQAGWNRQTLILLPAPLALSDTVELLWIDQRARHSPDNHPWRIVADDAAHVIYTRFTDDAGSLRHRLHVVGARTRYVDIDCSRRRWTVGARLRPGALPALFGVPANELTDRSVSAISLVRDPARHALARLELDAPTDAPNVIASFIEHLIARGRALDERTRWLATVGTAELRSVRDVAVSLGFGERALRSWSAANLGLGFRRFLSIRRLHRALESRVSNPGANWSRIAAASGFADQPHLVRDCQTMLGESPREFFARAS